MQEFLVNHGLLALFFVSFTASTILPLGSEWLLVALLCKGLPIEGVVITATLGNSLGAATTYGLGLWGKTWLLSSIIRLDPQKVKKAHGLYARYGAWSLLFSWLPVIGDPLCLVAGGMGLSFPRFAGLVVIGKAARYWAVAELTMASLR